MEDQQTLSYEQFVGLVRSGLHYLYDAVQLRRSPLVMLLGLQNEFDRSAALQRALFAAIRALKPPDDEPPQSRAWRIYDVLSLLYLRQLARDSVANQLGISERQLRREQRLAIEVLAQYLWQQPRIAAALRVASQDELADTTYSPAPAVAEWGQPTPGTDSGASPEPRIPLGEALENVRSLIYPLAQQAGVAVQIYVTAEIIDLPAPPMVLRTILLSALAVAVPIAAPGSVIVTATRRDVGIAVEVTCSQPAHGDWPLTSTELAALQTAQEQAAFYAAHLEIAGRTRGEFAVTLLLQAPQQAVVLVIDDNTDWLALVQRYAAGSPVQVAVTAAPEAACALAGKLQPALIVLDVMMHNVDGWQVLSELRHDPATSHIPVIVCTVLPLGEMALALGANAFLQKPVSQPQFLLLLDRFASA